MENFSKAADVRQEAERRLDLLTRARVTQTGEGYFQAYDAIVRTKNGARLRQIVDDANAIQVGQPTSGDLKKMAACH